MGGQLLVTQALDERELLIHKIMDKIKAASFVDSGRQGSAFPGKNMRSRRKGLSSRLWIWWSGIRRLMRPL